MDLKKAQPPLERQLALLGFELVHLEIVREGRDEMLRLYIDHLDAETSGRKITLDDCTAANEGLLLWMDVEFPDLREKLGVEICSPGMERPLVEGRPLPPLRGPALPRADRRPHQRPEALQGLDRPRGGRPSVTLEEDGVLKTIPIEAIQKARLAPFDEEKTPQPKHVAAAIHRST